MKRLVNLSAVAIFVLSAASFVSGVRPGNAEADAPPYEVIATVHPPPGSSALVETRAVDAATLESKCTPLLPRGAGIYQYGRSTPYGATSDNWSLAEVLSCGMGIPLDSGLYVQVYDPETDTDESQLSAAQLTEPSAWDQNLPAGCATNALPMIDTFGALVDSGGTGLYYFRPWLGPGDDNTADDLETSSPQLNIDVYPNVSSLTVTPSAATTGRTAAFSATVTEQGETTQLPASELTWHWSFGDGSTSTAAAPTHTYAVAGTYSVTATVTFTPLGLPGTGSIGVPVGTTTSTTTINPGTGGSKHATSPNGPAKSSGSAPAAPSGHKKGAIRHATHTHHHHAKPKPAHHSPAPATAPGALNGSGDDGNGDGIGGGTGSGLGSSGIGSGVGATGGTGSSPVGGGTPTSRSTPRSGAGSAHHLPKPDRQLKGLSQPLTGVLVSSVTPRGSSGHRADGSGSPANAPTARAKSPTPIPTAVIAGAAALLLLGFGVVREVHHGRRPRPRRLPAWFGRRPRPSA